MSSEQKQEQPKSVVDKSTEQNIPPSESDLEVTTMQVSLKPTKRSIQSVREVDHFKSENTVIQHPDEENAEDAQLWVSEKALER
ncbi:hypothetical protein N7488_012292 [Penicillium malachiteum]|nr:hypothetical protein N7488_012292 [Penicillium malachiteum]